MAVTVIGDAFIDIVVPIHSVKPGETYHRIVSVACGGTANVAIEVANLGEEAKFLGKIGSDTLGTYFVENLRKNKVEALMLYDDKHPTGLCVSLVYEDGERSMVANRGANDDWTKDGVDAYLDQVVKSRLAYFSGYSLMCNSEAILYIMGKCRGNCEICFNPGAPNIINDSFIKIIESLVDVLVLNLDEARSITGRSEVAQIIAELGKMVDLSVITLGKAGCIISTGKEWIQVPQNNLIENADTTGAGDAFSAGFMVGRLRGMDMVQCGRLGHETAASFLKRKKEAIV